MCIRDSYYIHEIDGNMPYIQLKGEILGFETIGEGRQRRLTEMCIRDSFYTVLLAKAAAFFASFPLCVKSGNGLPLPKK